MIGEIINAGAQILQGALASRSARINTDKTNRANRQLAEYQYSKDLEMWNRQNEYNNPASQMLRLKEAGLNPNMAYGSGSVAGNTSSTLPKYNAPRQEYNYQPVLQGLPNAISAFQDFRMKNAQIDLVREQEKNARAQATYKSLQNDLMEMRKKVEWTRLNFGVQSQEYKLTQERFNTALKEWEATGKYYGDPSIYPNAMDKGGVKWIKVGGSYNEELMGTPYLRKYQNMMDIQQTKQQLLATELENWWMKNIGNNLLGTGIKGVGALAQWFKGSKAVFQGGQAGAKGLSNKFPKPKSYGNYPGAGMR